MVNQSAPPNNEEDQEQSFISHLVELRSRLLACVLCVFLVFLVLSFFAKNIYEILAKPLLAHLGDGATMIATEVAAPFLTPFKLTLVVSAFISMPYLLYQTWAFVAPGLYRHERRLIVPLLVSSSFLFYAGIAFAYFIVFPLMFAFFIAIAPEGVTVMTDISKYLDFVLTLFLAFGLAFEVPIATILLVKTGITTSEALSSKRPYVIVAAFVIGALLTPPDVVSQILLAVPICLLYELGVVLSRLMVRAADAHTPETE